MKRMYDDMFGTGRREEERKERKKEGGYVSLVPYAL
jgi:hypothetical protein